MKRVKFYYAFCMFLIAIWFTGFVAMVIDLTNDGGCK